MGRVRAGLFLGAICVCALVTGITAGPAIALTPSVETLTASSIEPTTANLRGNVNPNGLETKFYFEYGLTTSYGTKTAETSAGSGTTTLEKTQAIGGLSNNTTYHYRIVASNSSGTGQGADTTFKTLAPPEMGFFSAEPESSGEAAVLSAYINPKGQSTTYQFEYGTAPEAYTTTVPIPAESAGSGQEFKYVSYKITGLTPGTRYYWRMSASSTGGNVSGEETSFLSSNVPGIGLLPVTETTQTGAILPVTIEPHGSTTKWYFEWGLTTSYGKKNGLVMEVGSEVESATVSRAIGALEPSTLYHYRVVTENSAGKHVGKDQTFETLSPVTLWSEVGAQIKAGETLKLSSSKFVFGEGEEGTHSCNKVEFAGEVSENPGAHQGVTTGKIENTTGGGCPWIWGTVLKYSMITTSELAYGLMNSEEGGVLMGEVILWADVYSAGFGVVANCRYNFKLAGTYETGPWLEPVLFGATDRFTGESPLCPPSEPVSGTFTATTGGKAVEAKP